MRTGWQTFLAADAELCRLSGDWTLAALRPVLRDLRVQLRKISADSAWDLSGVSRIDSFAALLLWHTWQQQRPELLVLPDRLHAVFERVCSVPEENPAVRHRDWKHPLRRLGQIVLGCVDQTLDFVAMLGMMVLEGGRMCVDPRHTPLKEFSAALYKTGVQAMPIAALVGFLVGIVLSYLSAMQLRNFGADALIINILGIGIIRELGPVLVSILVAGRSGSAITAQLGVMRVTEELDALAAIGVSVHQRLVWPKVLAMSISLPLLVLWTSAAALLGGMLAADIQLDIGWRYFLSALPHAVPVQNLFIGLFKGCAFGVTIALLACHFGLRIQPNTESLSRNTTSSVVSAITAVILLDAIFAMLTRGIGVPLR